MIGIDTSVLVRYLVRDSEEQFRAADRIFGSLSRDTPGFIALVTVAETYWVLARRLRLSRAECLRVVRALVQSEVLEFEDGETVVRALQLAEAGADFADALIEGSMQLFGVAETVTFDRAAAQRLGWRELAAEA